MTASGQAHRAHAGDVPLQATEDLASLAAALRAEALERVTVIVPHAPRQVEVQGYRRRETLWTGDLPPGFGVVPNKLPYVLDGAPLYPELLLVRLLERAGWSAAWRKTWNGVEYWRDLRDAVALPPTVAEALEQISLHAGHAGHWEVIAWRGRQLRLLTSRRFDGQPVSAYQADWLSVALRMGLPIGCFAVVEQRVPRPPRRRRLEHIQPA